MLRGVLRLIGKGILAAIDILLFAVRFQITLPINAFYNRIIIAPGKENVNTNRKFLYVQKIFIRMGYLSGESYDNYSNPNQFYN